MPASATRSGPVVSPGPGLDAALVAAVRAVLTEDLLTPAYRRQPDRRPTSGHCYAASEALYHAAGGKAAGWTPARIRHEGSSHWFLRGPDGQVVDATADQFGSPVPYAQGVGCGFLTREPSRRAAEILRRLR